MRPVCVALLVLILPLAPLAPVAAEAAAGPIDFAALDAAIAAQMAKHGLPGAALAVVEGGGSSIQGLRLAGRPMTPQTQMFIGSQSKSFTAWRANCRAGQARPERASDIPWFRVTDEAASGQITINHLLHHTSGLSEAGYSVILPVDATTEEACDRSPQARLIARRLHQSTILQHRLLRADLHRRDRQRSKLRRLSPTHVFDPLA